MDGASGVTKERASRIAFEERASLLGSAVNLEYAKVDALWNAPDLGDGFRAPVISSAPTRFISGTLDCNTPPFQAEEVRWGFSESTHLIIDGAGHETWMSLPEAWRLIRVFLSGEELEKTRIALPPLQFVPLEGSASSMSHPAAGNRQ